jgi:hypothetical protein
VRLRRKGERRSEAFGLGGRLGDGGAEGAQAARGERLQPVHGERPLVRRRADQAIDALPDFLV